MPGSLIERPKMTRTMFQALKRHIMKERERKRHEQGQDAMMMKRLKMEEEMRKKKEQEDSLTLEQTKEQISQLEKKMEDLKTERHALFSQLKEVLRQEDETRKMEKLKEQSELQIMQQSTVLGMPYSRSGRPMLYRPLQSSTVQQVGMKRGRSPSPPPSQSYQYSNKKMATHSPQPDYEQEHDAMMMKRLKMEEEMRKKKEQEDSLTLEQTKEQISQLEKKMEDLKNEKHELFSLLKEVYRQEYETRKMEKLKEQSELQIMQHNTVLEMSYSRSGRPMLYRPPQPSTVQQVGMKRGRSPSPPPSQSYQYSNKKMATSIPVEKQHPYTHSPQPDYDQQSNFPQSHTGAGYIPSKSPVKYNPGGQSAFSSYSNSNTRPQTLVDPPFSNQPNQTTQSRPYHHMSGQHPGRYFLENTASL